MNTNMNRSRVAAVSLRSNLATLRKVERRVDDEAAQLRASAFAQIESVAEELEQAAAPDPEEAARA